MFKFSLIFFSFVLIILISSGAYFFWQNLQPNFSTALIKYPIALDIQPDIGVNGVADQVAAAGLIKSKTIFKIYALITGKAERLQNGYYEIDKPISIPTLVEILTKGPEKILVTIPPGATLKEIDDNLSRLKILQPGDLNNLLISQQEFNNLKISYPFLNQIQNNSAKNLEGFLLPDTYYFYLHSTPNLVAKKILDNFQKQITPLLTNFSGNANLINTIKIASLLEKEIPDFNEQKIAAGIIKKRLKSGMPLQIDAAILYGKCQGKFLNCSLIKKDFEIDSPYNTYLHTGLPPTPISNPNIQTIEAVIDGQDSNYWYYLSDPKTKKTIFSVNLNEQTKNRLKYLNQ